MGSKEILAAVQGGNADDTLHKRVIDRVRPLLEARDQTEAKRKAAASAHGQFVLQLGTTVGRAMALPMLGKVADAYDQEVERTLEGLTSILEPVMIVVMGGIVAVVALSILLPMLNMSAIAR